MDEFDALEGKDALYSDDDFLKAVGRGLVGTLRTWRPAWTVHKLQAPGYLFRHVIGSFRSVDVKVTRTVVLVDENVARSLARHAEIDLADPAMVDKVFAVLRSLTGEDGVLPGPEV